MKSIEFVFVRDRVPLSLNLRCWGLNILDGLMHRFSGGFPLPGEEFDVRQACFQFVHFKNVLDLTLDASASTYRSAFKFTSPSEYVGFMLPGIEFTFDATGGAEEVDPETVIGCSWQQHAPPSNPEAVMEKLNASKPGDLERAEYTRVGDLPLLIAGEGKNRVELFRRHKKKIVAEVRRKFPAQSPVLIRNLSGKRWLASWKNKHGAHMLAAVPFPSVALPIYRFLGVEIRSERLPVDEADVERSLSATIEFITDAVAVP